MLKNSTSAPLLPNGLLPAVLHLNLTKKWFDMIKAGIKKEEYREVKTYWAERLLTHFKNKQGWIYDQKERGWFSAKDGDTPYFKHFDFVEFRNGYKKDAPLLLVECNGITIGDAMPEWSDNWQGRCFVIRLGKIVLSRA